MTKRNYFTSKLSSPKTKQLLKAGRVVFAVHTVLAVLGVLLFALIIFVLTAGVDTEAEFVDADCEFGKLLNDTGLPSGVLHMLEETFGGAYQGAIGGLIVLYALISLVSVALAFWTYYSYSFVAAICSLLWNSLAVGGIGSMVFGTSLAMLIFAVLLDKEYKEYLKTSGAFINS